jgi:hypothetical protein
MRAEKQVHSSLGCYWFEANAHILTSQRTCNSIADNNRQQPNCMEHAAIDTAAKM